MKRYLIAGVLLAALIAAGFFLPPQLMEWKDRQRIGNAQTEKVQEVVLREQASLTLLERILLTKREGTDGVDALKLVNGKNYTEDAIGEQVRGELLALMELGILTGLTLDEDALVDAGVLFFVDLEDTEKSAMIWSGTVRAGNCLLDFELDDESGKIVSISQYYYQDFEDVLDRGAVDDNVAAARDAAMAGNVDVVVHREPLSQEELKITAERWGEYLGCTVTDVGYYLDSYFSPIEEEQFWAEVEAIMAKGYSEEEARWKAASAWGIEEEIMWMGRKAILSDGKTEVGYVVRSSRGSAIYIYSFD